MKNLAYIVFLSLAYVSASAQIAVGKTNINGNSTLLDFEDSAGNVKALILPATDNVPAGLTADNNGTFLFDKSDQKLKMFENTTWKDLSDAGDATSATNNATAEKGNGVIIGAASTSAVGVLVLESANKAMILPKVAKPHLNIKSPHVGTMCYDTVSKSLAVFDGLNWNYWK